MAAVLVGTSATTLATAGGRPPCSGNVNADFFGIVPVAAPTRPVRFDVELEIHLSASSHFDGVGREKGGSNTATVDLFTVGGPDELLSESKLSSSGARFLDLLPLLLDISVEVEHSRLPVDAISIYELVFGKIVTIEPCTSSMIGKVVVTYSDRQARRSRWRQLTCRRHCADASLAPEALLVA
jgi:hypothetical protein